MSNTSVIFLVAACAGVFGMAAFVGYVVVPAWTSYARGWQRVVASLLCLYVLATLVALGGLAGYGIFRLYTTYA